MSGASLPGARALPLALFVIIISSAVVVATEFIVVGLLPVLSRDFGVSTATAGALVGAFALSASVLGPPLTLAAASLSPRRILIGVLVLYAAGNLATLLWPDFAVMMAVRIVQGAALPVFISAGTATVSRLASPERAGRSLAFANTGFAIGVVFAVPVGVALAQNGLWTPSFMALAGLAAAAAGLVAVAFPRLAVEKAPRAATSSRMLADYRFILHLALSVAAFAAMFAAYTYLTAWLAERAGYSNLQIALVLAGFGAAGLIGIAVAARIADEAPLLATALAVVAVPVIAIGLVFVEATGVRLLLLGVWGIAHTACVTLCQVRVTLAGRVAPGFAMALNISAANLGIALGALVGGWVVARWGVDAIGWGSLGLVPFVLALAAMLASSKSRR